MGGSEAGTGAGSEEVADPRGGQRPCWGAEAREAAL